MANVLVIGPHPDDQELGMGGTIARLASQGHDVLLLDVTDGCPTPRGDRPTRLDEAADAVDAPSAGGGQSGEARHGGNLLDLPNRRVVHSIESRYAVAGVIRAHQASILFIPHPEDAHPDHLAVTRIAEDARFDAKLTSLSLPGDGGKLPLYPKWVFYLLLLAPSAGCRTPRSSWTSVGLQSRSSRPSGRTSRSLP